MSAWGAWSGPRGGRVLVARALPGAALALLREAPEVSA